jgi:hypothetical protein
MSLWVPLMFLIPAIVFAIALRRVVRIAVLLKDPALRRGELTDELRSAMRGLHIRIDEAKLRAFAEKAAGRAAARSSYTEASRTGVVGHTVAPPSASAPGPVGSSSAAQIPTRPPAFDLPSRSPLRLVAAFACGIAVAAAIAYLGS